MLCQIRGVIISHAKLKAKEQRKEEKVLLTKIEFIDQQLNGTELSTDDRTLLSENFTSLQRKYETIREIKMRGYQIRSRAELTSGWEKPSNFFLNLEKKHFLSKTISELVDENDNKVTDSVEILKMQQKFYQDLFTSKKTIPIENSTYSSFLENLPRLSETIKESLDLPLTLDELEIVIKQSKLNKAPGLDGYTNEFLNFSEQSYRYGCLEHIRNLLNVRL